METLGLILTLALIIAWLVTLKVAIDRSSKIQQCQSEKAELQQKIQYLENQLRNTPH